jgi:hypothetical protein
LRRQGWGGGALPVRQDLEAHPRVRRAFRAAGFVPLGSEVVIRDRRGRRRRPGPDRWMAETLLSRVRPGRSR